jgi:hypothetical protein
MIGYMIVFLLGVLIGIGILSILSIRSYDKGYKDAINFKDALNKAEIKINESY